jgi:hypothetical protein
MESLIISKIQSALRGAWKARRRQRRILLYTDSRGTNITGHKDYLHYGARLESDFEVEAFFCPEKWTTTLDFIKLGKELDLPKFDAIVLHTGIVDASPRSKKNAIEQIYPSKKEIFDEVFGEAVMANYLAGDLGCKYEDDDTINLYSLEMARKSLLPRLCAMRNLIWISSNRIVPGWRGNYWKDRPNNIAITEQYSQAFLKELPRSVDLMRWGLADVQRYTFDNIHPNQAGSDYIYDVLRNNLIAAWR